MKKLFLPLLVMCSALLLSQKAFSADLYIIAKFQTNMDTYGSNTVSNLKDGNFSTKFWSSNAQVVGHYITADLGSEQPLQEINLYFASGDQPTSAKVEISSNGTDYEELSTFTQSDIGGSSSNYLYSCSALNKSARYVKFTITAASSSWFQMTEFQIPIPDEKAPSRTITVSVNDATMGKAYIGTEGTTTVTTDGPIMLMAVANAGYAFTSWTLNGTEVSKSAEYIDNVEGDKNFIANFSPAPYDDFCTPAANTGGNKRAQSKGEILNASGVVSGSTLVFYPSGSAANQAWSNRSDMVKVESGATFDLKVTYGTEGWNDLSVYQMTSSTDYSLIYGPYDGAWTSGGSTTTLFSNINAADDAATADASAGTITFPITIPQGLTSGDAIVVRFIVHGSSLNGNPCATGIAELNYCDYIFYVDKGMSIITVVADPSNGGSVAINDGTFSPSSSLAVEENGSAVLKAQAFAGYQFVGWYDADGAQVSTDAEYTISNVNEAATYTAKFEFIPVAERTVTVVSSDETKGSVAIIDPATTGSSISSTGIVTVKATPADADKEFVNWTDANGDVVSTEATYKYDKEGDITLTANFKAYYTVTIDNSAQGGTIIVSDASGSISSGSKILEGTSLTITVTLNPGRGVETMTLNGESILAEFEKTDSYTFELAANTTISATYGEAKCILTYEYKGSGYVEVWTSDTYTDDGPYPVDPAGSKYALYDNIPYGENVYIFFIGVNGGTFQTANINGEPLDSDLQEQLDKYGDIEYAVTDDLHIEAFFSGNDITGVEDAEAEGANINVYAANGGINIVSAEVANAEIYNLNGMFVRSVIVDGTEFVSVPSGIYAIVINGETYKVVVK